MQIGFGLAFLAFLDLAAVAAGVIWRSADVWLICSMSALTLGYYFRSWDQGRDGYTQELGPLGGTAAERRWMWLCLICFSLGIVPGYIKTLSVGLALMAGLAGMALMFLGLMLSGLTLIHGSWQIFIRVPLRDD